MNQERAKQQLGLKNDVTVLLTIGDEYKYSSFAGYDFTSTMVRILKRNSKTVLYAIGPKNLGRWAQASAMVNGRIRALGRINFTELNCFYDAAGRLRR